MTAAAVTTLLVEPIPYMSGSAGAVSFARQVICPQPAIPEHTAAAVSAAVI